MSDWDERFASLQRRFRERIDQTVPKGDPIGFAEPIEFVLIRDARDLAREARALLAQREAEIEALRELAKNVIDAQDAAMQHPITEGKVRISMNAVAALRAALSDNQEGRKSGTVPVYGHGVVLAEDGDTLWFLSDSGSHWSVRRDVMTWDN